MEKLRNNTDRKSCKRFLTFLSSFLIFTSTLFSQTVNTNLLQNLKFAYLQNQQFQTNSEIIYQVIIQNITPEQITLVPTESSYNSEDYKITSVRKIDYIENFEKGTKIEAKVIFNKKGLIKIEPYKIKINNTTYQIPFEQLNLNFNPNKQSPIVIIDFSDGTQISSETKEQTVITTKKGEKLRFTLSLQYIIQLHNFSWELPKDSIFKQLKEYSFLETKVTNKEYSGIILPISDFEWTPLVTGELSFPDFHIQVTDYNGCKNDVKFPNIKLNIEEKERNTSSEQKNYYPDAFVQTSNFTSPIETKSLSSDDCIKLCNLRSKERHSVFSKYKKERIAFENELGLPSDQNEFPVFIFYLSILFFVISILMLILFIRRKELLKIIIFCTILAVSLTLLIYSYSKVNKHFAISKGCKILAIPEETAESKSEIPSGSRIELKEHSEDWYYIQIGDINGWCNTQDILLIK